MYVAPMHAGYCPTPGCGGISVLFLACPPGVCPTGPIALDPSSSDPDLYSRTITLTGGGLASRTGPTAGRYTGQAIRMIASSPVSVTALVLASTGSGASVVMPTNALGTSYLVPILGASTLVSHFIVLVAGDTATTVAISGVRNSVQPFNNTGPQTITLQPYDTYFIRTTNYSIYNSSNLSGMLFNGTSPFVLAAGCTCIAIHKGRCAYSSSRHVFRLVY